MNWIAAWKLGGYLQQIEDGLLRSVGLAQRDKVARVRKAIAKESTIETFTFLGYDEGGMIIGSAGARRLVCVANSGRNSRDIGPQIGDEEYQRGARRRSS